MLLPNSSFRGDDWEEIISEKFWISICNVLEVKRLARLGEIVGDKRESTVEILVGDNDWVIRKESGIKYGYPLTKCMFSSGNINERRRMGEIVSKNEIKSYFQPFSILKAHIYFYKNLRKFKKKRAEKFKAKLFPESIVYSYFVKNKKKFDQLNKLFN